MTRTFAMNQEQLDGRPLPRRLGDPVYFFRRALGWWLLIAPVVVVLSFLVTARFERALGLMLSWPISLFFWLALPNRRTNAFYLRAFRTDAATAETRKAIQAALGDEYRLSGIRAPARRWPQWLRSLNRVVFCLHYSSVRYMNLEAQHDWLARLWRSLGEARCAFVDLVDVTEHVATEITLACRALGFERVLFLGDASRSVAGWQSLVCEFLAELDVQPEQVRVALWLGAEPPERRGFERAVKDFANHLPDEEAGLNWDAFPVVRSAVLTHAERRREAAREIGTFMLGLVPALVLEIMLRAVWALPLRSLGLIGMAVILGGPLLLLTAAVVSFVRELPNIRQKLRFSLGFLGVLVVEAGAGLMLLAVTWMNERQLEPQQGLGHQEVHLFDPRLLEPDRETLVLDRDGELGLPMPDLSSAEVGSRASSVDADLMIGLPDVIAAPEVGSRPTVGEGPSVRPMGERSLSAPPVFRGLELPLIPVEPVFRRFESRQPRPRWGSSCLGPP